MMKKGFTPAPIGISSGYNQLVRGFTLLELIVVIIIVGILATLGITQYGRMVEKMRTAEARQILGDIRKLGYAYWLANGTVTGMTNADVNIGTASDQLPAYPNCRSSHYFCYNMELAEVCAGYPVIYYATRCTSGGKSPQGSSRYFLEICANPATGRDQFRYCPDVASGENCQMSWP